MLRLRPYKPHDAQTIVSWVSDETTLRKWSADLFGPYPITAQEINQKYIGSNGGCPEPDNFYPVTAFDDSGVVGHMILRFTDAKKSVLRFGFVIVDSRIRGQGYGKEMLQLALKYAFEILKAEKVTLGVFENNPAAYHCYRSVGFQPVGEDFYTIMGEKWKCLELEITRNGT